MHTRDSCEGLKRIMIATPNTPDPDGFNSLSQAQPSVVPETKQLNKIKNYRSTSQLLLSNRIVPHSSKAGLNPIVDAACYLLSLAGKFKFVKNYRHLNKLQRELIQEINIFDDTAKNYGYNTEYVLVCQYILCATLDEIILHTSWGKEKWQQYALLSTFNQENPPQDKFFTILERAIADPPLYIDLMELIHLCLSLGYKGHYRDSEQGQYQLEQVTNNLYKHIRAYRGNFSKTLSPTSLKAQKYTAVQGKSSLLLIFVVTACFVMILFISLGYLMDVTTNETYKNIKTFAVPPKDNIAES